MRTVVKSIVPNQVWRRNHKRGGFSTTSNDFTFLRQEYLLVVRPIEPGPLNPVGHAPVAWWCLSDSGQEFLVAETSLTCFFKLSSS